MATCNECGHDFFFIKIDGQWYPYEFIPNSENFATWNDRTELVHRRPVRLHQCQREWVREFRRRLATACPKCEAPAGEYCTSLSGSYPRQKLKTLMHQERQ